jgi:hypothetical protein
MFRKFLTTLIASLALFSASTAQATPARALSLGNSPALARAASEPGDSNELTGAAPYLAAAIALGLVIWGIAELSDSN